MVRNSPPTITELPADASVHTVPSNTFGVQPTGLGETTLVIRASAAAGRSTRPTLSADTANKLTMVKDRIRTHRPTSKTVQRCADLTIFAVLDSDPPTP